MNWPKTPPGYVFEYGLDRPIWTPAGFLARGDRYVLTCDEGHSRDAPLQLLVDRGHGDLLMRCFKWKCADCQSRRIHIEVISAPEPTFEPQRAIS